MPGLGTRDRRRGRRVAPTLWRVRAVAALFAGVVSAHAQDAPRPGSLRGQVVDAATRQPLAAAAVVVLDRGLATVTGADGRFTLADVPPGLHRVQVVLVGYESAILHDVVVRPDRVTPLAVALDTAGPTVREVVDVTPTTSPRRRRRRSAP